MKLWSGRFSKGTDKLMDDFHASIGFDSRLYRQDIMGSAAHVGMLGRCGIIPQEDAELIKKTLFEILDDIEKGLVEFDISSEDIHMNIETILIKRIGDVGKKLHTGRSRNDQIALDTRMYLRDETESIKGLLITLEETLIGLAEDHYGTIMPGYTHLQRAQPVTLAHHLMAYFQMFRRDIGRLEDCRKRMNVMPLGSGALASTTYPIDRMMVARELGFDEITENSLDGVSDRDFVIELLSCLSIVMMHLSRFSEELILWSTSEFSFIEIDDAYSTGSSIMPQKKNPDAAELVRGKSGRVFGSLMSLLTMMKGLPLSYNKDLQEDKEAVFDAVDTVKMCLRIFIPMIATMKVNRENMLDAAKGGFTNATDLADYLTGKGIPFRDSHEIVGKMVAYCIDKGKSLEELSIGEMKSFSDLIEDDVYEAVRVEKCVDARCVPGGPAVVSVRRQVEKGKKFLEGIVRRNTG
jgi:argininosuccinate lyase